LNAQLLTRIDVEDGMPVIRSGCHGGWPSNSRRIADKDKDIATSGKNAS
jgi:hypothetical protein